MKAFVITIIDNEHSVRAAETCIASAEAYDLKVSMWSAITPNHDNFIDLQETVGLVSENFENPWSRKDNAIACFLSMVSLWSYSVEHNEDVLILEHDAIMNDYIPDDFIFDKVCTLGKPSFGGFNIPTKNGTGPLVQKRYFGGAHGYIVSPEGAQILIDNIPKYGMPTDVYLNLDHFDFLEEYYPWVFHVDDSFSTIQKNQGCLAKHNYSKGIELIEP